MSRLEACSTTAQQHLCGAGILPALQSPTGRKRVATKPNTLQAPPCSLSIVMALRLFAMESCDGAMHLRLSALSAVSPCDVAMNVMLRVTYAFADQPRPLC